MTRVDLPPKNALRTDGLYRAGWWHTTEESGRIVCDLCPRECHLKPGDRGFCFVRQNVDGEMMLTTYGRSTGFCIDPIEKKPLNHFLPGTSVLSFGTAGCNLGCKFCQNWDISKSREVERLSEAAGPDAVAEAAASLNCRSVAYTYNDPVIWAEYAIDTAKACRARGIKNVAVTAGYISPDARRPFYEFMDAANVDLKAFTEDFYYKITYSHLQPVLDTLEWLKKETNVWFEITNLMIPDANDSMDEVRQMCDWILQHVGDSVPVHFTAFHPDFRMRDRPNTPLETLLRAYETARQQGIQYPYVGNVNDVKHQSTYCPACRGLLIQRNWYELGEYHLNGAQCGHCGAKVAGVFESQPGDWGRKRQPVAMDPYARRFPLLPPADSSPTSPPVLVPLSIKNPSVPNPSTQNPSTQNRQTAIPDPPSGATHMSDSPASDSASPRIQAQRPKLEEKQEMAIHQAACEIVASAIHRSPPRLPDRTLAGSADKTVMGAFVTLKRQGRLRACCGALGRPMPLIEALAQSAQRTALDDSRLPPISPSELRYLDVDVTLLYGFQPLKSRGADRVRDVVVGRHGLQIQRGQSAGLLLPSVATEQGYDAETFLQQVCRKAGLPTNAWMEDATIIQTFEGVFIEGEFDENALAGRPEAVKPLADDAELGQMAIHCGYNIVALLQGATPSYYLSNCPDGTVQGVALTVKIPQSSAPVHLFRMTMRPGMPLQSTLFGLCENAANAIRNQRLTAEQIRGFQVGLSILEDSSLQGTVAAHDLRGLDPRHRAIMVIEGSKSAWVFDRHAPIEQILQRAVREAQVSNPEMAGVYGFSVVTTEESITVSNVPRATTGSTTRPPAVAGRFYPGNAQELSQMIDDMLGAKPVSGEDWPALMMPHAGLIFSGRVAGETIRRVKVPDTVIVIGPKHTRLGVEWAVAPHDQWSLPGITLDSDPQLARRLCEAIPGLQMDAAAHQQEHAIEVELPFISRMNPRAKVVGIVIGGGGLARCKEFATGLANVLRSLTPRPLLIISSDMNHYANDDETRQLDELAIQSLEKLNPEAVVETITRHNISMCGVLPAVIVQETLRQLGGLHKAERVAYATSADVSGDRERVVGYSGMLFA